MFIPVATDAPLYHRPWATVSLIAVNTLVFIQHGLGGLFGDCHCEGWILEYGGGLQPLQWVTCHFIHFSPLHLVGNMIFLWAFGMVVEGKIGCWRFLLLYLGIGIAGGFLIQMRTLNYDGLVTGAGGASLVVYGLIAIALIWAPENEVDVVFCFIPMFMMGPRGSRVLQVRIYSLALWYLVMELAFWWFTSRSVHTPYAAPINSELAHLLGAVLGAGAGIVMLKQGWVDCENWDLFSVWKGEHRQGSEFVPFYQRHTAPADPEENDADSQATGIERIQNELAAGRPLEAY